jgi:hypothetical protein
MVRGADARGTPPKTPADSVGYARRVRDARPNLFARTTAAVIAAGLWLGVARSQTEDARLAAPPAAEFHFARLVYADAPGSRRGRFGRGGGAWATDYADAEFHVMQGIARFTRVDSAEVDIDGNGGRLIRLTDERVFDYPWLYAVEVGQWYLNEREAALLREYLDRGGFLMVDDFWGEYEWSIFTDSMQRVFPDRRIEELGEDHELLHVLYDLDQRTQIPGRGGQRPGTVPHWRGIFDDDGRLMVAINFNMDMGDAWEHADDPWYPEPMTALAYRFAVNYLIYSMTH